MSDQQTIGPTVKFTIAGISGMGATLCVHPLDLLKNRMQLSAVGSHKRPHLYKICVQIKQKEGLLGFYSGLTAGLLRQAMYGSFRIGTYMCLMSGFKETYGKQPEFSNKLLFACVSGVVGGIVGNPSEIVLVRMTADGLQEPRLRRNYGNAVSAIWRIIKEENLATLWRGLGSTLNRAIVANAAELTAYSQSKQILLDSKYDFEDNILTHTLSSLIAALTNVTCSLPFDIAKTRIQNAKTQGTSQGGITIIKNIIRQEGIRALWKGFIPSFACIGPRTILIFVFIEFLTKKYYKFVLNSDENITSSL